MFAIGDWLFDPATRRICGPRGETRVSPKAAGVLRALAETPGQLWTRDALLERVWPNVIVTEEVLTHAIAELRQALRDDARSPAHIGTVHKGGYRLLNEPVEARANACDGGPILFDLDAYAMYLEGLALFDRGHKSNTKAAEATFRRIIAATPGFAPAHAGLAKSLTFLKTYYEPDSDLEEALDHCRNARRINPKLAEAHAAEGLIFAIAGKFDIANRLFSEAMRLDPTSAETHYLFGRACFAELKIDLAAPMLERAAALRPDDYHAVMLAGKARQMLGQEELARRNFAVTLARTKAFVGAFPEDTRALCAEARARFHLGQRDPGFAALERAAVNHEPCYHLACAYARTGESDTALDMLEQMVEHGWSHSRWLARDPDFEGYRHHPRFKRIARSIGDH